MKSAIGCFVIALMLGYAPDIYAQFNPVSSGTGGNTTQPITSGTGYSGDHAAGLPTQNYPANQAGSSSASSSSGKSTGGSSSDEMSEDSRTYEKDDTLYRGKTSESGSPMLRDEGRLHFKTRPKEKVQEVGSLRDLKSAPIDRNFEGNLLHSSVTSIEDVFPKEVPEGEAVDANSRFKSKQLKLDSEKENKPQTAQADSSPSPTPTATVSARAEKSNGEN